MTLSFGEEKGKTRLSFYQALFETVNARDLHSGGWSSTLDLLADYLAAMQGASPTISAQTS